MDSPAVPLEVSVTDAQALTQAAPNPALIIDVREPHEIAICQVPGAQTIPMRKIAASLEAIPRDRHVLVLCHHGMRSMAVTQFLRAQGYPSVSNIAGGINAWAEQLDPAMARY